MLENHFLLIANTMDADTAVMVPECYESGFCRVADTPWYESPCVERCVKTCAAYEFIGEQHPRIARYAGRDPWTDMPLFERPSGPSVEEFTREHHELMYTEQRDEPNCRPQKQYLPLMYQWALQALSAVSFCHKHNVIVGLFETENFLVSFPDLSISMIGFVAAKFTDGKADTPYESDINGFPSFNPFDLCVNEGAGVDAEEATITTDLFILGTFIYVLMTDTAPDSPLDEGEDIPGEKWPHIEREYLGEVVTKCWECRYQSVQEVRHDIVEILQHEGWEIEGHDTLKGFDASGLFGGQLLQREHYYLGPL
ncbi:hypothetical protein B0T10DRAFT_415913 [Thelonectria olida]|uniref:Protein kinase domain-containing protein n=1 Tax=Thelonectria olida TaxID=1576542 RepID=A0A9P8VSQ0_9HYPO|nr:hypothetical protein B0T10DRAFT_415913 [Thelonectria olida]